MSAARGCSPTARIRSPTGVLKRTTQVATIVSERQPDHQVELAEDRPDEVPVLEEAEVDVRDLRDVRRRALAAVDVDEEVAGDPEREEVDRRPADDLVGPQVDREERVDERERAAGERGARGARAARSRACRRRGCRRTRPTSIIPSRPMFTTPLRSEKMPPIAANASGVAKRSIAAVSADQTTTCSRWATLERVAR